MRFALRDSGEIPDRVKEYVQSLMVSVRLNGIRARSRQCHGSGVSVRHGLHAARERAHGQFPYRVCPADVQCNRFVRLKAEEGGFFGLIQWALTTGPRGVVGECGYPAERGIHGDSVQGYGYAGKTRLSFRKMAGDNHTVQLLSRAVGRCAGFWVIMAYYCTLVKRLQNKCRDGFGFLCGIGSPRRPHRQYRLCVLPKTAGKSLCGFPCRNISGEEIIVV